MLFFSLLPEIMFAQANWQRDMLSLWLPMILIGIFFYMMMLAPERRKRREHEQMLQNLKQNDRVVTVGGIAGSVVTASKDTEYVVIRVDENTNTRLRVLRSHIARVEIENKDKGPEKS
jgi:preprotein translocase subunit YajC